MRLGDTQKMFFTLARAGLWEDIKYNGDRINNQCSPFSFSVDPNWQVVYRLSEEQSVVGLVAAGIEQVQEVKVPPTIALKFASGALRLEQRNIAMNEFVAKLFEHLRREGINAILVKGQGIAQCYPRPLWRASGDVDLLLNNDNYEKAKLLLLPLAKSVEQEYTSFRHIGMILEGNVLVELHGTLHTRLSRRIDSMIDNLQQEVLSNGSMRFWQNGTTTVPLPSPDNDVIFLFTHILHHFFIEGIGLRQICDWCRFLWTYRSELDVSLIENRLKNMRLMSEWRAFAVVAVDWLGLPQEAMPFYSSSRIWTRKATRIMNFMLKTGNFGHNRQRTLSKSYIGGKVRSVFRKLGDFAYHSLMFPLNSIRFFCHFMMDGIGAALRGE